MLQWGGSHSVLSRDAAGRLRPLRLCTGAASKCSQLLQELKPRLLGLLGRDRKEGNSTGGLETVVLYFWQAAWAPVMVKHRTHQQAHLLWLYWLLQYYCTSRPTIHSSLACLSPHLKASIDLRSWAGLIFCSMWWFLNEFCICSSMKVLAHGPNKHQHQAVDLIKKTWSDNSQQPAMGWQWLINLLTKALRILCVNLREIVEQ